MQANLEPPSNTLPAIIARHRSRSREGARSSSRGKPSRLAAVSTASTCPCLRARTISNASPAGTSATPLSASVSASIASGGSPETFATVSWRTRRPSRTERRTK